MFSQLGWQAGLPWLYYDKTAKEVLQDEQPLSLTVGFYTDQTEKNRFNQLKYWLARYNLEGDFLGWQELKT